MSHFYVISPENSPSVFWDTKNGYYGNPFMPCCPVGLGSEQSFAGNSSAWPAVTHWERQSTTARITVGFSCCLSRLNEGNSCVFSQGILNFSNHIVLSHKYGQVKLKLNAGLMSHNFSSDLLRQCFLFKGLLCQLCYPKLLQIEGKVLPQAIWGKVLPWSVQDNWILGQFISRSGTMLTLGTGDWAPSQLLIGKKALDPILCRYLFRNLFICSDLLASIRKSKGFVMILADNSTGKTCKHLQHTFRSLAPPL